MSSMQVPSFGQNKSHVQQYYQAEPQSEDPKKKLLLFGGGILLLIILLLLVVSGGGNKAGQQEMQSALQSTSDALGIINTYDTKLSYTPTKNDVALTEILLRGNYQKLNTLYVKTYKPKKRFSSSPLPDKLSVASLDRSDRNNTLDNDILVVLKAKAEKARKKLVTVKPSFKKASSKASIQDSISDMGSVEELLSRNR